MRERRVSSDDAWPERWQPDARTVALIRWALAGQPESEPLPVGAAEILASERRADLCAAWNMVRAFGLSAAEPLRQAYGLPEELTRAPEGIVTAVQRPRLSDGIAAMLLEEPPVIGHDPRGFAITGGKRKHWTEMEWPARDDLRRYLFRRARNLLWPRMRREERDNCSLMRHEFEALGRGGLQTCLNRRQLLADVQACFGPIRERKPELARYLRILDAASDPSTGEVDWARVAKRYHVPKERIESFLDTTIRRRWKPELAALELQLSLYVRRRRVHCVRPDAELPGRFRMDEG